MSLINEALRRASQQPQNTPSAAETQTGLTPVDYSQTAKANRLSVLVGAPLILILLAGAWWFFSQGTRKDASTAASDMASGGSAKGTKLVKPGVGDPPVRVEPVGGGAAPGLSPGLSGSNLLVVNAAPVAPLTTATALGSPEDRQAALQVNSNNPPVPGSISGATTVAGAASASVPATNKHAFPDLKVQGVYYRKTAPSVLINGRALFAGESIEGARIVAIQKQSVTVAFQGKTNVLDAP